MNTAFPNDPDLQAERDEAIAKLPEIDRPELRLGHKMCLEQSVDNFMCTKTEYHFGEHIAHGPFAEIIVRWAR